MKSLHLRKIIVILLFISVFFQGFAQQNISVPLEDPVYTILDFAMIRTYCETMHNARPYTVKTILELLNQILDTDKVPIKEKKLVQDTIERLQPKTVPAELSGKQTALYVLKNGFYVWEGGKRIPSRIRIGGSWESDLHTNFNAPNISSTHWLDLYIKGDIGNNFSYNVNGGASIIKLDVHSKSEGKPD